MKALRMGIVCLSLLASMVSMATESEKAPPPRRAERLVPAAESTDSSVAQEQVIVHFTLYRVDGDIDGDTTLTDNVKTGIEKKSPGAQTGSFRFSPGVKRIQVDFFTVAKLTLGGGKLFGKKVKLEANEKGWTWNGKEEPPTGAKVVKISSPKVLVLAGQSFTIAVGQDIPIEYFEKVREGLYEQKRSHEMTGYITSGTVEMTKSGQIILRDLTIQLRTVESRVPIEGVSLNVGRPIIVQRTHTMTMCVEPDRDYGCLLPSEKTGCLIMRLRVSVVKPSR